MRGLVAWGLAAWGLLALAGPGLSSLGSSQDVLAKRAADLPRAEEGAWTGWSEEAGLPDELVAGYTRALEAWRARDFPGVLDSTWPLLESTPDHPALLHLAGHAQFRLRRYGECAALLARLVDHVPGQVGRTRHLAHAWNELGQVDRALVHYDRVLQAAPGDHEARRGRALARWRLGAVGAALRDLGEVLAARPEHAEAWLLRARILVDQEEAEQALLALAQHRALDPDEPEAAFLEARALLDLGRSEEAAMARARFEALEAVAAAARPLEGNLLLRPWDLGLHRALAEVRLGAGQEQRARSALIGLARAARLCLPADPAAAPQVQASITAHLQWAEARLGELDGAAPREAR